MKKLFLPIAILISVITIFYSFKSANRSRETKLTKVPTTPVKPYDQTKMKGFKADIQKDVIENKNFRKVLYTAQHLQLVLMSLKPGEEIGMETHANSDQFFRFEEGKGKCIINETVYFVKDGDVIIVPAGSKHNVINTSAHKDLKLYTIYALPNHKDGVIRATKKDAELHEAKFDGKTTE